MQYPKLFFGFFKTISLPHSNTYFVRHLKYIRATQDLHQTSTTYIRVYNTCCVLSNFCIFSLVASRSVLELGWSLQHF